MTNENAPAKGRIAIELDRLIQEVRVIQHLLDDDGTDCPDEMIRRLGYLATRANRIAAMVETDQTAGAP